eukprot:gene17603-biopygen21888
MDQHEWAFRAQRQHRTFQQSIPPTGNSFRRIDNVSQRHYLFLQSLLHKHVTERFSVGFSSSVPSFHVCLRQGRNVKGHSVSEAVSRWNHMTHRGEGRTHRGIHRGEECVLRLW